MRGERVSQIRELAHSLDYALFNDPGRLVMAQEKGRNEYERAIYELAESLYADGWRKVGTK